MNRRLLCLVFVSCAYCVGDSELLDSSTRQDDSRLPEELCQDSEKNCSNLSQICLDCRDYNKSAKCRYGEWLNITCGVREGALCKGDYYGIVKRARCIYCYQTEKWEHECQLRSGCPATQSSSHYYVTNCTVKNDVMCIGKRSFHKKLKCNWTHGHKWSTALLLSITLGGFGADRFYLGHWQEGIGKLFSFGGLGVWTLVDVLLIAIRYLGPADGSFYV